MQIAKHILTKYEHQNNYTAHHAVVCLVPLPMMMMLVSRLLFVHQFAQNVDCFTHIFELFRKCVSIAPGQHFHLRVYKLEFVLHIFDTRFKALRGRRRLGLQIGHLAQEFHATRSTGYKCLLYEI